MNNFNSLLNTDFTSQIEHSNLNVSVVTGYHNNMMKQCKTCEKKQFMFS
jgi:hypothetical protein